MYVQYVCVCIKPYVHFILSFKTDCNFILELKRKYVLNYGHLRYATCMCTFLKKKLCYDLHSYYWRVVMIIEYNMIITMIMIVKAVIKKHTCKILLKELFCSFTVY